MQIQWYPGHMAKAKRQLESSLKLVDAVVELCDARAPLSTRNPDLDVMIGDKSRLLVINKADLADKRATALFAERFREQGISVLPFTSISSKGIKELFSAVNAAAADKVARMKARGMTKTVRAIVIGIPNVGKSTLINRIVGQSRAKASDRPGVTRGSQWLKASEYLELLDTPGLLWPKLEDPVMAENLAFLGSIRDDIMDQEALAARFLLRMRDTPSVMERFRITDTSGEGYELLDRACAGRGWLRKGNMPDTQRGAALVLDEYRQGKCGMITLDKPNGGL